MKTPIYLGKLGKAFGPYTEAEYDGLRESGTLRQFSWKWNHDQRTWDPLDPPPAPLDLQERKSPSAMTATAPSASTFAPPAPAKAPALFRHDSAAPVEVVCHDRIRAVCGKIQNITEAGCVLVAQDYSGDPVFAEKSDVRLNVLDPKSGRAIDVRARLSGISREQGSWRYQVSWQKCPELVLEAIAA